MTAPACSAAAMTMDRPRTPADTPTATTTAIWPTAISATTTPATPEGLRSDHDHARTDLDATVQVDHVLVAHADAAGRDRAADRPGLVGAVDAVDRGAKIH